MPSHKQARLLRYIENYIEEHGVSPTYREMSGFMGTSSPSTAFNMVKKLVRSGKLTVDRNQDRAVKLTKPPAPKLKRVYDQGFRAGMVASKLRA